MYPSAAKRSENVWIFQAQDSLYDVTNQEGKLPSFSKGISKIVAKTLTIMMPTYHIHLLQDIISLCYVILLSFVIFL